MAKASKRVLDMTNVKDRGPYNPKRMPEGDYLATILSVVEEESKNGNDMWVYAIQLSDNKTCVYPHHCVLDPDSLWKVRNLFMAAGIEVPKKRMNVNPERIVGEEIGISLEDDEYEGREKSVIVNVFNADDLDKEEEPEPPKATKKAAKPAPAPVEDDEDDEIEEEEEAVPPPTRRAKRTAPATKARRKPAVEDDEMEELDLDEL